MDRTLVQVWLVALLAVGALGLVGPGHSYGAFSDAHGGHAEFDASTSFTPNADAGGPYEVYEGYSIELDGTGSEGNIDSYDWTIVDGNGSFSSGQSTSTPVYDAPDDVASDTNVTVELTVWEGSRSDSEQATITVRNIGSGNQSPIADFTASRSGNSQNVDLDGSQSSDPDGTIVSYQWDVDQDGTYEYTGQTVNNAQVQQGADVTLNVTDDNGTHDEKTKTVP
jgi:hypothetical protein